MIQAMLDRQMEETRRLLQQNREEATIQIERPELNEGQTEEGNYNGTVGQANPPMVKQNHQDGGNDGRGCKYKDFMASKPPSLSGSPTPVEVINWISEMEMVFESCDCSEKQKTVFAVIQLKTGVLSWWKLLADTMPWGEALKMSWDEFLEQLKA